MNTGGMRFSLQQMQAWFSEKLDVSQCKAAHGDYTIHSAAMLCCSADSCAAANAGIEALCLDCT